MKVTARIVECPLCGEIELVRIADDGVMSEWECYECHHYETGSSEGVDPEKTDTEGAVK